MRILLLTHKFYPFIGGIEINSEIFAFEFQNAGHEVTVMTWTKEEGNRTFPFTIARNPGLAQIFKEHRIADVVFENNPVLQLSWPRIFFKKPHVIAIRTWIEKSNSITNWQYKVKMNWLQHADAVIAVSEAVRKRCWPKATVIGNPYRDHLFRKKDNIKRDKDFAFLGRLVSDKGADKAIEAMTILKNSYQQFFTLTVIGDGPDRVKLEEQVKESGLEQHIRFAGNMQGEQLVHCLNEHKYLLAPSNWEEPFGNVALEGMACGCVPIVSDGGGLPDAVGKAGLVFQRGNVDALVACIRKVTGNNQLDLQLRQAATLHLAKHKPEAVSKRYLEIIVQAATR